MSETRAMNVWLSTISVHDVRRITNSAIFIYDTVIINSSAIVEPALSNEEKSFVVERLNALAEIGAISGWSVEGTKSNASLIPASCNRVVGLDEYEKLYERTNERFLNLRSTFLGESSLNFDGITEIVCGKQAIFHVEIANFLEANALIHDDDSAKNYGQFLVSLFDNHDVGTILAKSLAAEVNFPDVASLPKKNLAEARKYLFAFRSYLSQRMRDRPTISSSDEQLRNLTTEVIPRIIQDYREVRASMTPWTGSLANRLWRILQIGRDSPLGTEDAEPLKLLIELDVMRK